MLIDSYKRKLDYLRVSITDRCNLRCSYCMPSEGIDLLDHDEVLRNEEFVHLIRIFARLGIRKVRFTGGEPLVRRGFVEIVAQTREALPELELCLTTNGILLDEVLDDLRVYNVNKLNISLDSLSRSKFEKITGRDYFTRVISNIEKALNHDFFEVKINSVLHEEILDELDSFFDYFRDKKTTLRFIEKMPFSPQENDKQITCSILLAELEKRGKLVRNDVDDTKVARMYDFRYKNKYNIKIGIIPPVSHSFCSGCNRLRLTADGFLRTCLLSNNEYNLKTHYRMDMGDDVLEKIIMQAVNEKPKEHKLCFSKSEDFCTTLISNRTMSKIGG